MIQEWYQSSPTVAEACRRLSIHLHGMGIRLDANGIPERNVSHNYPRPDRLAFRAFQRDIERNIEKLNHGIRDWAELLLPLRPIANDLDDLLCPTSGRKHSFASALDYLLRENYHIHAQVISSVDDFRGAVAALEVIARAEMDLLHKHPDPWVRGEGLRLLNKRARRKRLEKQVMEQLDGLVDYSMVLARLRGPMTWGHKCEDYAYSDSEELGLRLRKRWNRKPGHPETYRERHARRLQETKAKGGG